MTAAKALVSEWNRMGSQMRFFVGTLAGIPDALMHYRGELLRVIAQMGLGTGVLAVIGGTVAIVGFLAMTTGAIVAVQGYNQFASVGVEALTGFASAFFNTREIQPGTVMVALAATVGAGTTAALGAMRINEEIDALEVIGIRSISYLASTRVLAGVVVAVPLFCVGLMTAYLAARVGTTAIYGQGSGVYDHYFNTFLRPTDVLWLLAIVENRKERVRQAIPLINTYVMSLGESLSSGPFFKAYVVNLLPGQFVQPFISAAFSDLGLDPATLLPSQLTDPPTGQPGTPPLPMPYPRTGQGGEPRLTLPDAITGNPGDPRYPYRPEPPAPPPGGPPPGPPAQQPGDQP